MARTSALRHAVGASAFRFGLLLGSPTLAEALGEWVEEPSSAPRRSPPSVAYAGIW
ncbi:MAG: hypothetical protein JO063_00710 [Pseudonocardiales bacterium]|nr:hypothetical protein [Pseudonocardiales bacterium]